MGFKIVLFALAFGLLLPQTVAPALAAGPGGPPVYGGVTSGTYAQLQALVANQPAPTAQQLATAQAYLAQHPFQGSTTIQYTPPPTFRGVTPNVSVQINWWGVYLHFTKDDIHQLWSVMFLAGVGAAAAILCLPTGWIAVACAVVGAGIGWLVAEIIWYYIGYNVPNCGVHIGYYWYGHWYWGNC